MAFGAQTVPSVVAGAPLWMQAGSAIQICHAVELWDLWRSCNFLWFDFARVLGRFDRANFGARIQKWLKVTEGWYDSESGGQMVPLMP